MADQSASPFFKLPPELRNGIYFMLFECCILEVGGSKPTQAPPNTGLLLTAKQTYNEAVQIYFNKVIVQSSTIAGLINWANRNQARQFYNLITELRIESVILTKSTDEEAQAQADNLGVYTLNLLEGASSVMCKKRFSVQMRYSRRSNLSVFGEPVDRSKALTLLYRLLQS